MFCRKHCYRKNLVGWQIFYNNIFKKWFLPDGSLPRSRGQACMSRHLPLPPAGVVQVGTPGDSCALPSSPLLPLPVGRQWRISSKE
jgi:hypothetical protein